MRGKLGMRVKVVWLCGLLAACSSGAVTVPEGAGVYEVPQGGTASTTGGDFTSTIEGALAEPGPGGLPAHYPGARLPSTDGTGAALDDDRINLMQWTLDQQKIDAAVAQDQLDAARRQLVIVQPGALPNRTGDGVNVALYATQSTNAVGQRVYDRNVGARVAGAGSCGRYRSGDDAQRAFLAAGGPQADRYGLDPDGDGFACSFDPGPYRALN